MLTNQEKVLYHQIHPLKLFTDISSAIVSVSLAWQHDLVPALAVAFVPSIIVSLLVVSRADLEIYKQSAVGRYIKQYMTPLAQALRLVGFVMMFVGAWYQAVWLIVAGLALILFCWVRGLLFPASRLV